MSRCSTPSRTWAKASGRAGSRCSVSRRTASPGSTTIGTRRRSRTRCGPPSIRSSPKSSRAGSWRRASSDAAPQRMNIEGGDAWTDLGDGILVRQSKAFAMNSVVLANAEHTILVDPGILPSEMDDLAGLVREAEPKQITLFFTHAHWDHVLGRPWWPKAKTLAHDRFAAEVRAERAGILADIENLAQEHGEPWTQGFEPFAPDLAVSGLKFLPLGPWRLVMRDAPGHSSSQLSCHLPAHGLLIVADMISDIEPPMLDGPCSVFRKTLEGLMTLAENGAITTVLPGHGAIARGETECIARLLQDGLYLTELEVGVNLAIDNGQSLESVQQTLTAMEYTGKGSPTYPTDKFHLENIRFAYEGVKHARR